ncbi:uncharacterized protein TRIADDRAFT_21530 [Trichoplax adhaerens]|uniref:Phospholipase A-2-activating protein n=1 Tax=Trichoplax adhaerens TaxID=10228 RepID=B3RNS1_TRIAD|nr:hypothetical protein TRIADDRAFT_21530 [Trichoplax adhaerens]EDV27510.1 hypothetical protein TRIADDRAFT_21530 [Trichoplax adhaerens]|eukprot:XP_002109344.1 hypothetical protein TRIADDRAFT_21530 [Trichoplax adhaerens]
MTYVGHQDYINSMCVMPPSSDYPDGVIFTGGHDNLILGFLPNKTEPELRLEGHSNVISALSPGKFGTLLSGSWDGTARVWLKSKSVMVLQEHEGSVLAVSFMSSQGIMITGSSDKSIKVWRGGNCERTLTGHTDCVRALCVCSDVDILSCGNDCTIRKWNVLTGQCQQTFHGHSSFIYGICMYPGKTVDFVSCGEDRSLRMWKDDKLIQTITHPAQSVWTVSCLSNGDIITGTSDGLARIFTMDVTRLASDEQLKNFSKQEALFTINASNPKGKNVNISELPGIEAIGIPGKKDGQVKMFRNGDVAEAYQWSADSQLWERVGEVLSSSNKETYEGKEYDHVFSVDVEEGKPHKKLPYNLSEDPWYAAQRFIDKESLPQVYLDQVAKFIIDNTKGQALASSVPTSNEYSDPFTGGSRYVPGRQIEQSSNAASDPFTGTSRYIPGQQSNQDAGSGSDPFTGNRPVQVKPNSTVFKYFPKTSHLLFDGINVTGLLSKLNSFNASVPANHQLTNEQLLQLTESVNFACRPENYNQRQLDIKELDILAKVLDWPEDFVFPGLDILRLYIRHPQVNTYFTATDRGADFITSLLHFLRDSSKINNCLLALRVLANVFSNPSGANLMVICCDDVSIF